MRFNPKTVILGNEAQDSDLVTRGTRLQGQNYNAAQVLNLGRRESDRHRGTVLPCGEPPPGRAARPPEPEPEPQTIAEIRARAHRVRKNTARWS